MAYSKRVATFYHSRQIKYLSFGLLLQFWLAVIVSGSAYALYRENIASAGTILLASGFIFFIAEGVFTFIVLKLYGQPFKIITDALAHVSGQPGQVAPPNVNDPAYEQSGLREIVQTIYELSVSSFQSGEQKSDREDSTATLLKTVFSQLPCDVVALDSNQCATLYHGTGGLAQLPDGAWRLSLHFDQADAFQTWLEECRRSKVRDTMLWRRVPNAVLGSAGERKIYDVIAHYEKTDNPEVETVLALLDRTAYYAQDEDDMDFIAMAAHELRGPITIIRGYLDVLNEELADRLDDEQKELFARMQVSSDRLGGYINNILNVSRFDRAHLKLNLNEETLVDIIGSVTDDVNLRARTQNRKLSFNIPENLPAIAADRSSLSEVIINLIDNAIKYSHEEGEISVEAGVEGDFVQLTVIDHGVGMPDNVMNHLFNKFYRSHRSRQTAPGTGLGLYISKAIIESHGGKIWARSTEGKGSTFGIMIPTYASVAEKLKAGDNGNENIIEGSHGWIKNHSMYRG